MTVVILIHQMVKMKLMVWRLNLLPHLQAKPKYPVSIPVCECLISTGSEYIWDLNGEVERSATVDKFFIHLVSKQSCCMNPASIHKFSKHLVSKQSCCTNPASIHRLLKYLVSKQICCTNPASIHKFSKQLVSKQSCCTNPASIYKFSKHLVSTQSCYTNPASIHRFSKHLVSKQSCCTKVVNVPVYEFCKKKKKNKQNLPKKKRFISNVFFFFFTKVINWYIYYLRIKLELVHESSSILKVLNTDPLFSGIMYYMHIYYLQVIREQSLFTGGGGGNLIIMYAEICPSLPWEL